MRVCILTTSFPLYDGIAVGIHVAEQARHMVKKGLDVTVVAPHHPEALREQIMDGISVHRFRYMLPERLQTLCYGAGIPTNLKRSQWARLQLPFLVATFVLASFRFARDCEVIQANWSIAGAAGILIGRLLNKPVVLMMYGAEIFVLENNPFLRFVVRNADHVIAISQYTLDKTLQAQTPRAYSLIPPGIDIQRFHKRKDVTAVKERLTARGVDLSLPLVFALGKFIERKGFSYLIDAMAILQAEGAVQLMIGGRGPLKKQLQRQAISSGIGHRVFFLDYIDEDDLAAYYSLADLFVSPSIVDEHGDTEGLGMVLLEAMACQTPCIASRVGGIPDIVIDDMNGYLTPPRDSEAIAEKALILLGDEVLRGKMGISGRRTVVNKFAWEAKAEEIVAVYRSVLGTKT